MSLSGRYRQCPFIVFVRNIYIYRVRPKKRRNPYLRYLWLVLNKGKTDINHFKNTISTI
jgi:hypothetical protein